MMGTTTVQLCSTWAVTPWGGARNSEQPALQNTEISLTTRTPASFVMKKLSVNSQFPF